MMVGLPDETDADIDELMRFAQRAVARSIPLALGIAPFVAKRNTPLDGPPFAGIDVVERRLERLRRGLRGRGRRARDQRALGVGRVRARAGRRGRRARGARRGARGRRLRDYERAFAALPHDRERRTLRVVA